MKVKNFINLFLISVAVLTLPACVFAPAIESFKKSGLMEGDRRELLNKQVKTFSDTLSMGRTNDALKFVADEQFNTLGAQLRKSMRSEKIVESTIDDVEFTNDSFDANVKMRIKYYRVPIYMVDERVENQRWSFSVSGGWKMYDIEKTGSKG